MNEHRTRTNRHDHRAQARPMTHEQATAAAETLLKMSAQGEAVPVPTLIAGRATPTGTTRPQGER